MVRIFYEFKVFIAFNVGHSLPADTNAYLLIDNKEVLLVDLGYSPVLIDVTD
ncbi:hypothetical protein DSUL_160102 [Desulfovibrionales bacterium]